MQCMHFVTVRAGTAYRKTLKTSFLYVFDRILLMYHFYLILIHHGFYYDRLLRPLFKYVRLALSELIESIFVTFISSLAMCEIAHNF